MVLVTDFFKKQPGASKKRKADNTEGLTKKPKTESKFFKKEPELIDLDSESDSKDTSIQEIEQPKSTPKKELAKPKTPKKSPMKQASKATTTAATSGSGANAQEILATIPDAELPDVSDAQKPNFFQLQQRKSDGPLSSGTADIPEAQPNCLSGLTIVFTGVLPTLERGDAESIAKKYGAKVPKSILGKTSLVVIGDEAGPSKVQKIKKMKIKAINEQGFIQLLQSMPADGGSGEDAVKAKLKREEEERKIIEDAEREENEAKQQEAKRLKEASKKSSPIKASDPNRLPAEVPRIVGEDEKLWTVKYAPTSVLQLCGNKGQVNKLKNWLSNWFEYAKNDFKDPGSDGSGIFRACLISGPPGIGKTTAAHLIAKDLGYDVLEKNASDVRSKTLLNQELKGVLNNTSVVGFFQNRDKEEITNGNERKFCLIMDEVDGMSSGDHGGAGALSQFCRITRMPMILICNDKSLPKMRIFDRVTLDLPFRRPSEMEVKARIMTICHREKIKIDPSIIGQLVQTTNNDIRQMINLLSTISKTQKVIGQEESKDFSKSWKKQTVLKPFDIVGKLLNGQIYSSNSNHTLNDKIDLYFNDIDFTPLMVQENYLYTRPSTMKNPKDHLRKVAQAADDISISDSINSLIRSSEQQWSLLPFHAVMSSVKPSMEVAGSITQRINFAGWLGQNSKQMKYQRLLQELQYHTRLRTSTDQKELRLDYIPLLSKRLTRDMLNEGEEGIESTIKIMDYYYLTKEDWDNIIDFGVGDSKGEILLKKMPTKVKSTFTRKYNASTHPTAIYKTGNSVGSRASATVKVDYEDVIEDDTTKDEDVEEKDSSKIDTKTDKLIKEVKPKAKRATKKKK